LSGALTVTGVTTLTGGVSTNSVTGDVIPGKIAGTNFTNSLLVGHATTGTLDSAEKNTGVGIGALDALTNGDSNVALGYNAGGAVTTGKKNILIGANAGDNITSGTGNVIIGNADAASATGHQTLKISGTNYNGSSTVTWIEGDISGNLTTTGDVTLANTKKVIFGDAGEHIVGDGTDLTISSSNNMTLDTANQLILDADTQILLSDGGSNYGAFSFDGTNTKIVSQISDKGMVLRGNDGGSFINALSIDFAGCWCGHIQ